MELVELRSLAAGERVRQWAEHCERVRAFCVLMDEARRMSREFYDFRLRRVRDRLEVSRAVRPLVESVGGG